MDLKTRLNSYTLKELRDFVRDEKIKITQKKQDLINDMSKRPHVFGNIPHKKDLAKVMKTKPKKVKSKLKPREKPKEKPVKKEEEKSYTRQDLENQGKVIPFLTLEPKYRKLYISLSNIQRENLKKLWAKEKFDKDELEQVIDKIFLESSKKEPEPEIKQKQTPTFLKDLLEGLKK